MPRGHYQRRYRYEPTPEQIAVACERIQANWSQEKRVRRKPRFDDGRVEWQVPILLDIVDCRGEYVCVMGN